MYQTWKTIFEKLTSAHSTDCFKMQHTEKIRDDVSKVDRVATLSNYVTPDSLRHLPHLLVAFVALGASVGGQRSSVFFHQIRGKIRRRQDPTVVNSSSQDD